MYFFLSVFLSATAAFFAVRWAYFKILKIAKEKNLVDNPDARKLQKEPIPVMGGIAVFFGVVFGLLVGSGLHALPFLSANLPVPPTEISLFPVLCAMVVMLYVGAMDDILGLSPWTRLIFETLAVLAMIFGSGGCLDSFHGMWGIESYSWYIAVPLTVFAGVGIINSINMIDGVNGLSSGLCIAISAMFGLAFIKMQDVANAVLAFSMAAAIIPFFFHNVFGNKSRMFLGDAGTMVMGVLVTWYVICFLRSDSSFTYVKWSVGMNMIALALAILCVPIFDTIRVMITRVAHGKSPFSPDKKHLHHALISVGISHSVTTLLEIFIGMLVVTAWAIVELQGNTTNLQLYVVVALSIILVWGSYFFLWWNVAKQTKLLASIKRFSFKTHLGHTAWWMRFSAYLDKSESFDKEVHDPNKGTN